MRSAILPVKCADAYPGVNYDVDETAKHLRDLMDFRGNGRVGLQDLKELAAAAGAERLRNLVSELTAVRQDPVNKATGSIREMSTNNEPATVTDVEDPTGIDRIPPLQSGVDTPSGTGGGPPMWTEDAAYR